MSTFAEFAVLLHLVDCEFVSAFVCLLACFVEGVVLAVLKLSLYSSLT